MRCSRQASVAKWLLDDVTGMSEVLEEAGNLVLSTLENRGKLLVGGSGGSAAEAEHLVTELVGRYRRDRVPLPASSAASPTTSLGSRSSHALCRRWRGPAIFSSAGRADALTISVWPRRRSRASSRSRSQPSAAF